MKKITKILCCLLCVCAAFALAGCQAQPSGSNVTTSQEPQKETLVMATNAEFPPYEYYDGDKIVGIDAELAQEIATALGMELKIEDMQFDSIVASVSTGKADIGVAGLSITEDRLVSVDFTDPYTTAYQVIIVPADSAITTPDDLVGKKVGVQIGTTGAIYAGDIENVTLEQYNKGHEAVLALIQGKIDAVIIDIEPAKVFVSENEGKIKLVDEEFTVEDYAIAVSKNNTELKDEINQVLADLKASGKLDEIISKYINAE